LIVIVRVAILHVRLLLWGLKWIGVRLLQRDFLFAVHTCCAAFFGRCFPTSCSHIMHLLLPGIAATCKPGCVRLPAPPETTQHLPPSALNQNTATIKLLGVNIVTIAWQHSSLKYLQFTASESGCVLRNSRHKKSCVYPGPELGWGGVLTQEKKNPCLCAQIRST
jgi:hypothetical protein